VRALAQLAQQSRVLYRNHRLSSETLQQCDLLFGKQLDVSAVDHNVAEKHAIFAERNCEQSASTAKLDCRAP